MYVPRKARAGLLTAAVVVAVVLGTSIAFVPAAAGSAQPKAQTQATIRVRPMIDRPSMDEMTPVRPVLHKAAAAAKPSAAAPAERAAGYTTPARAAAQTGTRPGTGWSSSATTRSRAQAATAPRTTTTAARPATSELAQAQAILRGLIARYPILKGTTVSIGSTPGGYQAVAYYTSGRIVISPKHKASLTRILNHEIWHVIDWRDNRRIDWGENVPPR